MFGEKWWVEDLVVMLLEIGVVIFKAIKLIFHSGFFLQQPFSHMDLFPFCHTDLFLFFCNLLCSFAWLCGGEVKPNKYSLGGAQ
jgi:hypothetical protein